MAQRMPARKTGGWTTSDKHGANTVWAEVLRELREARGLTRADLGVRTGLRWACVDKIERGGCCPRLDSVLKICEALDVPFVVVALVVELRLEGCVVPLLRVSGLWRRLRRIFRRLLAFGHAA